MSRERIQGPQINPIQQVQLPKINQLRLSNGIPVYILTGSSQEVIKLEIVIAAGRPYEKVRTASRTIGSLLKEGTENRTSDQIANELEFYGITFNTSSDIDHIKITFFSLSKYFDRAMNIVVDILSEPAFPNRELDHFKSNIKLRLELDLMKNDVLAYRTLTESIYGENHPYGYNSTIANYQALTQDLLVSEYNSLVGANRCTVFLSGNVTSTIVKTLEKSLENYTHQATRDLTNLNPTNQSAKKIKLNSPNPYQSALRYGKRLFNKHHDDYAGISVLSTLLGGYFGSRLMSNIREDKGYTYNIYSGLDTMVHNGYFYIATEVGKEYLEDTKVQIKHEINVLQTDLVSDGELQMVKNYMAGNYLNMLDGPLKSSRVIRNIICSHLDLSSFDEITSKTLSITSSEIRDLAIKYLDIADMTEVVV